jgi:putative alpha-1,2-mannosidase
MAKAVADTTGENQAGFAYDTEVVTGFSHMHDSGTGGVSFRRLLETMPSI